MSAFPPKTLPVLFAAALALPAAAETLHYNLVEFHESASVSVKNDTMILILNIQEESPSRQQAADAVTRRLNAVLARARDGKRFKTETAGRNVRPVYDDKSKIRAWQDSARVRIESSDFAALSKLAADSQNEAMIAAMQFSVSPQKRSEAVEQASAQALQAFRRRAESMSRALGFSGYKIVRIGLNQSFDTQTDQVSYAAVPMAAQRKYSSEAAVMETEAGEQHIRQTVNATVQMY